MWQIGQQVTLRGGAAACRRLQAARGCRGVCSEALQAHADRMMASNGRSALTFGIGVDVAPVSRFVEILESDHGRRKRMVERFCHVEEVAELERMSGSGTVTVRQAEFLAARWAAKEACYKAFGRWRIDFPDMQVAKSAKGVPRFVFHGQARALCDEHGLTSHVSLSHDGGIAVAMVLLEHRLGHTVE